jgi:hypothetical protein
MTAPRSTTPFIALFFLAFACNDVLGFREGKPYPSPRDAGVEEPVVDDAADATSEMHQSANDARETSFADVPDATIIGVDGGDAGCATPACGGCIDLSNDSKNCGGCGHDCSKLPNVATTATVPCSEGKCVVTSSACASGFGHCSSDPDDGCETNLKLPSHCLTCLTQCPVANPLCTTEGCKNSCSQSEPTLCGGTCVNLNSDVDHCNDCATPCPSAGAKGTRHCVSGQCTPTCNDGSALCDNQCPDYESDPNNCGTCRHSCGGGVCLSKLCCAQGQINANGLCCAPGEINSNGKCCPAGQTNCGGTCVNTAIDDQHCGGCTACSSLQKCTASVCLARDGQTCAAHSDCASGVCTTFYRDTDGDGHGSPAISKAIKLCGTVATPSGYAASGDDCCDDDRGNQATASKIHPGQMTYFKDAAGVCGINFDYDCDGHEIDDRGAENGSTMGNMLCTDGSTCVTSTVNVTVVCGTAVDASSCYQHAAGTMIGASCTELSPTCAACHGANGLTFLCK